MSLTWSRRADLRKSSEDKQGYGTRGTRLEVGTNLFKVKLNPKKMSVWQYEVMFKPEKLAAAGAQIRREIFTIFKKQHGRTLWKDTKNGVVPLAYDGDKLLFTPAPLEFKGESIEFDVKFDEVRGGRAEAVKVIIIYRQQHDLSLLMNLVNQIESDVPGVQTQAMDIALKASLFDKFTTFKTLFFPEMKRVKAPGCVDFVDGFTVNLRPGVGQWLCNVNFTVTPFYRPNRLIQDVADALERSEASLKGGISERDRQKIVKIFRQVKFVTTHSFKKVATIKNFSRRNAIETTFECDGEVISVAEYFERAYNVKLQYPQLPLVQSGRDDKPTYYPMEVCQVRDNQRYKIKIDPSQTADLIKKTSISPSERLAKIMQGVAYLGGLDNKGVAVNPIADSFGIDVDMDQLVVPARKLKPPTIVFGQGSQKKTQEMMNGTWNMQNQKLLQPNTIDTWSVLILPSENRMPLDTVKTFVTGLVQMGITMGMTINNKQPALIRWDQKQPLADAMKEAFKSGWKGDKRPQLMLVILNDENSQVYATIKHISDQLLHVPTQCVQSKKVSDPRGPNPQYLGNVILKVNVKVGGSNFAVEERSVTLLKELKQKNKSLMMIGADLSHLSPSERQRLPSTAALVGSIDANCTRYTSSYRFQFSDGDMEVIQQLGSMMLEILKVYFAENRRLPDTIMFYRDGISEGQYERIGNYEITTIQRACGVFIRENCKDAKVPTITYIVAQKRHHVRLFPLKPQNADRSENVMHGTVVDQALVHPWYADFYLLSHPGLKGTSRPTRYVVLYDEAKLGMDDIQEITYLFSFTFARATRGVGLVTPVYYAHLLAERARIHLLGNGNVTDSMTMGSTGSGPTEKEEWLKMVNEYEMRNDVMVYI